MLGYIFYGEVTERGSRKFLNVLVRKMKNGVAMCKRKDQKKFYRKNIHFSGEEEFLSFPENVKLLQNLLDGETVYL